jgi:transcription initiation factor TFIIIB Brf1 subunit/transcription initiation factor TFIIB
MTDIDMMWRQYDELMAKPEPIITIGKYDHYNCQCGGVKYFDMGELPVCSSCGLMDFYHISEEPEWTSGIDNDGNVSDPSRCGMPSENEFFSSGWNMGTKITTYANSTYANKKMSRIHFHTSMNHKDRALFHAYAEISRIARDKLGCTDNIIDAAKILYKEFNSNKLTRGDVRLGVKANCVFLACKQYGYPRTTKEIADAFSIDTKDVGRTSHLVMENVTENKNAITMPKDVIGRILGSMKMSDRRFKCKCVKVCELVERDRKLMGKTPSGIAAAVIFIVLNDKKIEICQAAGVSIPTMNKMEMTIRELIAKIK